MHFLHRPAALLTLTLLALSLAGCPLEDGNLPDCRRASSESRDARWQTDIRCTVEQLKGRHPNASTITETPAFRDAASQLERDVPQLSTEEIIAGLKSLVARFNDVHTAISAPPFLLPASPVRFEAFDDGVFAVQVPKEAAAAAGKELLTINGLALADVFDALADLEPDETPAMRPYRTATLLSKPGLLWARGLAGEAGRSLATLDGYSESLSIDVANAGAEVANAPDTADMAVSFTDRDRNYWATTVPELRLLYIQYNLCFQDLAYPVQNLAADVRALLESGDVDRVLVDLRYNPGGISSVMRSLKNVLAASPVVSNGGLYVAIGPATYSAALTNAIELRDELDAVLIGNPTTERANHYGDVLFFTLQNTGVQLRVSSTFLELDPGNDGALEPDITLPRLGTDFVNGIDPVFEWLRVN